MNVNENDNSQDPPSIEAIAEQWVNLVLAHIKYKVDKNKDENSTKNLQNR